LRPQDSLLETALRKLGELVLSDAAKRREGGES
jgi:hypothetical protein